MPPRLDHLLKQVSRAFYLTLRILPRGVREPIGLAYLLARAADTIADTAALPPPTRLGHLLEFRRRVSEESTGTGSAFAAELVGRNRHAGERALLTSLDLVFEALERLPETDRVRVRSIVSRLTEGMEFDLRTFPPESSGELAALETYADLERYTYLVAGCVGEFWTEITSAHVTSLSGWDLPRMSDLGVRFGKALQYTNVLRDVASDLRIGRCYLPIEGLVGAGVTPRDLLDPANAGRADPLLAQGLGRALEHYRSAEAYVLAVPRRAYRLRLAALWPVLIGLGTLVRLGADGAWLDPERPAKVSRAWVYRTLVLSLVAAPSNRILRGWLALLRGRVLRGLATRR